MPQTPTKDSREHSQSVVSHCRWSAGIQGNLCYHEHSFLMGWAQRHTKKQPSPLGRALQGAAPKDSAVEGVREYLAFLFK